MTSRIPPKFGSTRSVNRVTILAQPTVPCRVALFSVHCLVLSSHSPLVLSVSPAQISRSILSHCADLSRLADLAVVSKVAGQYIRCTGTRLYHDEPSTATTGSMCQRQCGYRLCVFQALRLQALCATGSAATGSVCFKHYDYRLYVPQAVRLQALCASSTTTTGSMCHRQCSYRHCVLQALKVQALCATGTTATSYMCHRHQV